MSASALTVKTGHRFNADVSDMIIEDNPLSPGSKILLIWLQNC